MAPRLLLATIALLELACVAAFSAGIAPHGGLSRHRAPRAAVSEAPLDSTWKQWAATSGVVAPKLRVCDPLEEERGKGGVYAAEPIAAMEVIARIPRQLILSVQPPATDADPAWAAELTRAALLVLHPEEARDDEEPRRKWVESWVAGGWATDSTDLGREDVRWGGRDVTGSLMATGSDNDRAIYAKFRFPCHPVVHRAHLGLAMLTRSSKAAALDALLCRGREFRAMRDDLLKLVSEPTPRASGSVRDRRSWDVADMLSRVLSRATTLQLGDGPPTCAIVPLHERLAHCSSESQNARLLGSDPLKGADDDAVVLVATRAISAGEPITRDYTLAPRLPGDTSEGALRLLLQFGLPPSAWGLPNEPNHDGAGGL